MQQKRERKPIRRGAKAPKEYDDNVIEIRRVARVVKGGKRFSFRATVVIGNKRGKLGVGMGKGLDVATTIAKAKHDAEKKLFTIPLKDKRTIPYDIDAKYCASRVRLKPTREGHGLIAGGSARAVLELAGVKDISAKLTGKTTNKLTNAMATVKALKGLKNYAITQPATEPKK
jgi:small subunit ribosomal protein S5